MKKITRIVTVAVAGLALTAASGTLGWHWWNVGRYVESTDDAYLQADYTTIAPKVSGYVAEIRVADNQKVEAGRVLARIDDRDFRVALSEAKARVATAADAVRGLDARLLQQRAVIEQARSDIDAANAANDLARDDTKRYRDLARTNFVAGQRLQQAETRLRQQSALVRRDHAELASAERGVEVLKSERAKAEDELAQARAAERQAELNLGYTTIVAPVAGTVGERKLRIGQYVQAGTPLMAIVPLDRVYVVANFKETQLTRVRPGQPATIAIDTFPGVTVRGRVDSLAPASGLEFALLPPDNATGNFTKVVQRIPVKIVLDAGNPLAGLLRPGMSVEPSIDTRGSAQVVTVDPHRLASAGTGVATARD